VLALRDGDAERYAASGDADALYDVNDHLLGQLISAPVPPSLAPDRARMMEPPYAETEEGQRQRMRHGVLRRLVDDPVLYLEDLVPGEREWLEQSRGFVYRLLRNDLGLVVEKRAEGLAGVDPDGDVTDLRFPDGRSTLKHMALLLGERMVEMARHDPDRAVEWSVVELAAVGRELAASYGEPCGWKKEHLGSGPAVDDLTEQALALLAGFGLVRRTTRGWAPRPALARFRPMTPDTWEQQQ